MILKKKAVKNALEVLPGWKLSKNKLKAVFRFKDFVENMKFVNLLAVLAEKAGHHPDLKIQYNQLEIVLWTHSAGGVTQKDLDLAEQIGLLKK